MSISRFDGEHKYLSNFFPAIVEYKGITYKSSEAAYQSAKSSAAHWKGICAFETSPGKIKKMAARIVLPSRWSTNKIRVMREVLICKFEQNPDLAVLLVSTYPEELVEGNDHGDKFWGTVDGVGKNMLGKLLMEVRTELMNANR